MDLRVTGRRDLDAKFRAPIDDRRSICMYGEPAGVLRDFGCQLAYLQCSGPGRVDDESSRRYGRDHCNRRCDGSFSSHYK